jgi:benzoyl-CoA reductase/2-hydroxyglutaryl-CoA dehydratase subunit BcrC/BadD/HgdB
LKGLAANQRLQKTIRNQVLLTRAMKAFRRPVAWVTSGSPVELMLAAGITPFYPENHAAICSARNMAADLASVAEGQGYSRDLCSYFRIDVGSQLSGRTPLGKIVPPDLVLVSNNICGTVQNWFRVTAEHYGVPFFFLDTPFSEGIPPESDLLYVREQMVEIAAAAGKIGGRRVTEDRLAAVVKRSREALELWRAVLHTATARPAPFSSFDAFIHMAPIVSMRGTRRAVRYYRKLLEEVEARRAAGVAAVPGERSRVVWDNIAIWPAHREMKRFFKESKVALVGDTYTQAWTVEHLDPADPFSSLARAYTDIILNHGAPHRVDVLERMVREFGADGFILHSNRSCKRYSLGQLGVKKAVTNLTGTLGVVIEADMADPRAVSFETIKQRLEPFFEILGGRE